ncbi:MAG: polysaccharide biosynthesis protein [Spirochaetes bacterium]|nr:polysaccharide biosynthesis protein [Spirochaetota bacterium]
MSVLYTVRGKRLLFPIIDAAIIGASFALSCAVLDCPFPGAGLCESLARYCLPLVICLVGSCYLFQIYRIMWSYSNIHDVYRLLLACVCGYALFLLFVAVAELAWNVAFILMMFLMSTLLAVFYRVLLRDYYLRHKRNGGADASPGGIDAEKRILVIGAGEAGHTMLSEYVKKGLGRLIDGFADDDPAKIGRIMNGKLVFCDTGGANRVIRERGINEVIIAMPSVGSEKMNRIASEIRREHRSIPIKVMPHQLELDERKPLSISLRDISIADLIGREEVRVDAGVIEKKYAGKTMLITGAGGSIGSEICRQLLNYNIRKLVAVGRGEFSMYNLIRTLNDDAGFLDNPPEIAFRIADIKDYRLMDAIFSEHRPDIVFHAAAHKHVPLMEFNEAEAVQNNVQGTKNLLELSHRHGVGEFVFISTDKAVNPTSVMGATKRIAEILANYYRVKNGLATTVVRFGNVIGSRGSVIPLFMEQIEQGGPVTVTHPDVTRYFMSIPEASLLVLNAAAYSAGGELFVLDMGRQYRVAEIAQRLIEFYGYRSDDQIRIEYTGLRPGEKMHEDLFYGDESLTRTPNEKIFILAAGDDPDPGIVEPFLRDDLPGIVGRTSDEIRQIIKKIVPEFEPGPGRGGTVSNKKLVS